jgi:ABC-type multidrug transport system ATPase subunit
MVAALELESLAKSYRAGYSGCVASARVLECVNLRLSAGEVVGVAGDPGAGKTTLLLCAAGLLRPDRGSVRWFGGEAARPTGCAAAVVYVGSSDNRSTGRLREAPAQEAPARVVLADDPPLLRDARPGSGFVRLLADFAAAGGAVLLTSRDPAPLATVATRILLLRDGRLVATAARPAWRSIAER